MKKSKKLLSLILSAAMFMSLAHVQAANYPGGYEEYGAGMVQTAPYPDQPDGYTVPDQKAEGTIYAMEVYKKDGREYLYTYDVANRDGQWNAQVKIYDATDRTNMTYQGFLQGNAEALSPRAKAIEVVGNKLIVVSGQSFSDVAVYDLTDPASPVLMAKYTKASIHDGGGDVGARDFFVDAASNKVYVVNIKGYILVADLSLLPTNPEDYGKTLTVAASANPVTFDNGKMGIYSIEKAGNYIFLGTAGKTSNGVDGLVTGTESKIIVARENGNEFTYVTERSIDLTKYHDFSTEPEKGATYQNRNVSDLEIIGNYLYAIYDPADDQGYADVITALDISDPAHLDTADIKYNHATVFTGGRNGNRGAGRLVHLEADKERKVLLGVGYDYTNIFEAVDGLYVFSKLVTWNGSYRIGSGYCGVLSGNKIYTGWDGESPRCYTFTINDIGLSKYGFGFTPQAETFTDWYNMAFNQLTLQNSADPVTYTFDVYSAGNYYKNLLIKYKHNAGVTATFDVAVNGRNAGKLTSFTEWGNPYTLQLDNVLLRNGHNTVTVTAACPEELCLDFLGFENIEEFAIDESNVFETSYDYDFENYEEVVNSAPYTYHYESYASVSNQGYAGSQGAFEIDGTGFNSENSGFSMQNISIETGRKYRFAMKLKILKPTTTAWGMQGAVDDYDMTHYGTHAVLWNGGTPLATPYFNWNQDICTVTRLEDGWYQLTYDFTLEPQNGEKKIDLSFFEFRIGGANTKYIVDDWTLAPAANPVDAATEYFADVAAGDTLTVDFPTDETGSVVYRHDVFVSADGEHWAHIGGGNSAEARSASYTVTDREIGKYVKLDVLTYNQETRVYNRYTTKSDAKVTGITQDFKTNFLNDKISAVGYVETPEKNGGIGILALYDKNNRLIHVETGDIRDGKVELSAGKTGGSVSAKMFLWDSNGTMQPYSAGLQILDGTYERIAAIKDATIKNDGSPLVPEKVTYIPAMDMQLSSGSTAKALIFESVDYKGKPTSVFAYMSVPAAADPSVPVPAVVLVHGQGGEADLDWMAKWDEQGYAVIATDWMSYNGASHIDEASQALGYDVFAGPLCPVNYFADADYLEVKDQWMYRAVCGTILARNLVASQPGVDKTKVGIAGISFGGLISTYVVGADSTVGDERFSFAVPAYLSGFYEEGVVKKLMSPNRQLWDSKHVLANAKLPILFVNSTKDDFNDVIATTMSYDETSPYSTLTVINGLTHGHAPAFSVESVYDFANSIVKGTTGLLQVANEVRVNGREVSFDYTTTNAITQIKLDYNTGGLSAVYAGQSNWQEQITGDALPANTSGTYTCILPEGAKGFLFELMDSAQNIVSTRYVELN